MEEKEKFNRHLTTTFGLAFLSGLIEPIIERIFPACV